MRVPRWADPNASEGWPGMTDALRVILEIGK
jgi:hypothetical protein